MATKSTTERRCCRPFSQGALLVLVWSTLLNTSQWFVYDSLFLSLPKELQFPSECVHFALWIILPVTGWVAEARLGRYRAITTAFILSMLTMLASQASFIMLHINWTPIPAIVLLYIALAIGTAGFGMFYTNLLPFTLDQMMGASGDELSAAVHWYCWGYYAGCLLEQSQYCIPIPKQPKHIRHTILLTLSTLCLLAVLLSDYLFHKWLDPHQKIDNPIKLIFRVLNYARKNKYPRKRSAFTYLDEEQPSRLDFGKDAKFGGPFTEEEVEDVKTILRVVPLLVSATGASLSLFSDNAFQLHVISTTKQMHICVAGWKILIQELTAVVLIPAYRFILYPVFYKYIPSMLKRIGVGLFLCFVNTLINLILDTVGHLRSNTSHCMFDVSTETIPIQLYWLLISDTVGGVGATLVFCSLFEFIMAQTPNRMRGVMMGLAFTTQGMSMLATILLGLLFQQFNTAIPSCGFYYYLVLTLLILLISVLFVTLAKNYKRRERSRHVNIQAIAEEHYERYFDQEEEYMREVANRHNNCS